MKKLLVIFLAGMMILSLSAIGVSAAPEGIAIKTTEDFNKMGTGGTYYLDADIKIDATYTEPFHGYLNGNGHTVTISAPMFSQLNGKVTDLTIQGALTGNTDLAPLALDSEDGIIAVNVVNKANVTVTGLSEDKEAGIYAAGFVVQALPYAKCIFRNCKNFGDITNETNEVGGDGYPVKTYAAGFCAYVDYMDAKMCENHGNVTALGGASLSAGFGARITYQSGCEGHLYIFDCLNTGEIKSLERSAGFVAHVGVKNNDIMVPYEIAYSMNTGNITGPYEAGGICGYCYASKARPNYYIKISNCISIANVTTGYADAEGKSQEAYGSLLLGYSNSVSNTIENCLGQGRMISALGTEVSDPPYLNFFGCSTTEANKCPMKDNLLCDYGTTKWYSYSTGTEANRITFEDGVALGAVNRITEDEVKNGTALQKLNAVAGAEVFVQQIGKDDHPMFNSVLREKRAEEYAKDYEELEYGEPEETTTAAPETTTAAPETTTDANAAAPETTNDAAAAPETTKPASEEKKGGCGSAIALGAILGLIPLAFVLKKKRK